jgi:hypothetical protein
MRAPLSTAQSRLRQPSAEEKLCLEGARGARIASDLKRRLERGELIDTKNPAHNDCQGGSNPNAIFDG